MFCEGSNITNYADDNSPFSCNTNTNSVIEKVEHNTKALLEWFKNNGLKANPDKFHLILSDSDNKHSIEIDDVTIFNSNNEKLLGINIDNKLSFDHHVAELCRKASQKLHALARMSHFMDTKQREIIFKSFIYSQFGYCPLVWMFHSRKMNSRINKIHERALRIIYDDKNTTFRINICNQGFLYSIDFKRYMLYSFYVKLILTDKLLTFKLICCMLFLPKFRQGTDKISANQSVSRVYACYIIM